MLWAEYQMQILESYQLSQEWSCDFKTEVTCTTILLNKSVGEVKENLVFFAYLTL
jgi:hypothetical protein